MTAPKTTEWQRSSCSTEKGPSSGTQPIWSGGDQSIELRGVDDSNQKRVDVAATERRVPELLVALGENPNSEHLRGTPGRVARAFEELLTTFRHPDNLPQRGGLRRARGRQGHPLPQHLRPPPASVSRQGPHRLPAERSNRRTEQVGSGRGTPQPVTTGPGDNDPANRCLAQRATQATRGWAWY
jgi:hypothetical protein